MSTPKQIAASRANGAKSKGPATPEGKLVSSRNSTRHGLFAETIVLEAENTARFVELVESLFEEHNPRTPTERLLVENIAAARWRQWRIWGMQKVAFDHEVASPSTTNDPPLRAVLAWRNSAESIRTHELLLRYEIALDRQISRSLLRLQQMQDRSAKGAMHSVLRAAEESAKGAMHSVLRGSEESAKGAPHSVLRGSEGSAKGAPHSVLRGSEGSAKGAQHSVLRGSEGSAKGAPHSVLRGSEETVEPASQKSVTTERTQQPVETTISSQHEPSTEGSAQGTHTPPVRISPQPATRVQGVKEQKAQAWRRNGESGKV